MLDLYSDGELSLVPARSSLYPHNGRWVMSVWRPTIPLYDPSLRDGM